MDVSPQEPPLMAMDLSKSYNPLTRGRRGDLPKKPEWYHRRLPGSGAELAAPAPASLYRTRAASSSSYASIPPSPPTAGPEPLGGYMSAGMAPHLELYRDGVHGNLWHPGFYGPDRGGGGGGGGGPAPESSGGEESDSGSDVIFLVSSAKEPLLCGSFIQDGVRHMVEPLSPAASSPDDGRGCYHLPQPLSSPSPDSSYSEDSSDSSVDIPVHHARPVVLLSNLPAVFGGPAAAADASSDDDDDDDDDSDVVEVAVTDEKKKKAAPPPPPPPPQRKDSKTPPTEVKRSTRIRNLSSSTLPYAGGGGARRHNLRRRAKNDVVGIYNESLDSDDVMEFAVRATSSDESLPPPNLSPRASSESEPEVRAQPEPPEPRRQASPERTVSQARKRPLAVSKSKTRGRTERQQSSGVQPQKKKPAARRRRKRRPLGGGGGGGAPFPPREPEIQLRFLQTREKKEKKCQSFRPFVRMERRTCVVVNYQEDEARGGGGGEQQAAAASRSLPGFVPNTSCFQLGRLGSDGRSPASLSCCLCGQSANAMGLGDLHGPYCPATAVAPPALNGGVQEEETRGRSHGRPLNSSDVSSPEDGGGGGSPAKAPLRLDECWIHEDCGVWSAGVFLVRGRLYGLEEAARLAQETVCSTCQQTGAIMGCFQKGCSRNYHHRCAVQSGCVLNEDNFSMRCPEHKNKRVTCASRRRRR